MSSLSEIPSGIGRNLIDLSGFSPIRRVKEFFLADDKEVHGIVVRNEEIASGNRAPIEMRLGGRQLIEQLGILLKAGFKIDLQKPEPKWVTYLKESVELARMADLGIITQDTLPFFKRPTQDNKISSQSLKPESPFRSAPARAATAAVAAVAAVGATYVGSELLRVEATPIPDIYGPEVTREQLEASPQIITATDYVNDVSGNVIKQRAVVNGKLYESAKNQTAGAFEDFKLVSTVPMGNVTSLISSSDGNTLIAGGEDPFRSANTKLVISYDAGKTWNNIDWPYQLSGSTSDLIRFTDNNYLGNNGNYEGGVGQFIMQIDPSSQTASVRAASLTVQATNLNIGSAHDLRVASVVGNNVQMYSAGSLNLQSGFVGIGMDYTTGIGTARNITQTLISGQLINLGYLQGTSLYTDTLGNLRLEGSNRNRGLIYDINPLNPLDNTATQTNYNSWLDGRGIPNYIDGSFTVQAFGVAGDGTGNQTAYLAGGYNSTIDGGGRAVVLNRETMTLYDLMPDKHSGGVLQKGFLRKKINGQSGYEVNILYIGKAFIPDGGSPVYTDRGLGSLPPVFKIYLPAVMKNY